MHIRVEAFRDPVCDALGFDPRHPYFEFCYVPIIGPSSAWLVRRLVAGLEGNPHGYELELSALSRDLGLGEGTGRHAPMRRTLDRVARFGLARWIDDRTYQVRRRVPPLTSRQLGRLGPVPLAVHRRLTEEHVLGANALLAAALDYAERGWPVLPLRPAAKVPHGSLALHGLHDATCDPSRIKAWWKASPTANVGIRTGLGIDVIDIDGIDARAALEARCPEAFDGGLLVATGRGWHLYFATSGLPSRTAVLPGVDVRGAGGYVVAPPSAHPDGQRYRFVDKGGDTTLERPPEHLVPVPQGFLELCNSAPPAPATRGPVPLRSGIEAYARRALAGECAAVKSMNEGARNDRLNRAAFSMGTLVGARALDGAVVAGALLQSALSAGLSEREATRTITSGLRAGIARPRQVVDGATHAGEAPPVDPLRGPGAEMAAAVLARAPTTTDHHPSTPAGPTPTTGRGR